MQKAIWWSLAGLLIGLPLGDAWGAAAGAIAGTLIGAVLGALPSIQRRRQCASCAALKGCVQVCEPQSSGMGLAAVLKLAGVAVAAVAGIAALHALAPFLMLAAGVSVVLAAVSVPVLRRARVLCVPRSSKFHARYQAIARPAPKRAPARKAITEGPRAIEAGQLPGITVRLDAKNWERIER